MDKERKAAEALARGETKRTKEPKNIANYLSSDAKQKNIYGSGASGENGEGNDGENGQRGKCY
jgi:hypothetical protein